MIAAWSAKPGVPVRAWAFVLAAFCLFAINLAYKYPGVIISDSASQLIQIQTGLVNDWHPPAMTRLWQALMLFGPGPAPLLIVDILGYWLAFGLIGYALLSLGRPGFALLAVLVGATPIFIMLNIVIGKDNLLLSAMLLGFALLLLARQRPASPFATPLIAAGILLVLFAGLVRHNGMFAVGPLLAFAFRPRWLRRPILLLIGSTLLGVLMVPVVSVINHDALRARDAKPIASLEMFDLAGIAHQSGDVSVFGPRSAITAGDVDRCYSPVMWDTLSPWGRCPWFTARAGNPIVPPEKLAEIVDRPSDLSKLWLAGIAHHPLAYLEHRIAHYNTELFLFVPEGQTEDVRVIDNVDPRHWRYKGSHLLYLLRFSILFAPALYAALAAVLVLTLAPASARLPASAVSDGALALAFSATLYAASYAVVGVAADTRYFVYAMAAVMLAIVMLASEPDVRALVSRRRGLIVTPLGVAAIVLIVLLTGRLLLPIPAYVHFVAPGA